MFTNWEQSNWASLLEEAAFAYNSKVYATTKRSPIELAYGQLPNVPDGVPDGVQDAQQGGEGSKSTNVELAETHLQRLRLTREAAAASIMHAQQLQAKYYNRHHLAKHFAVGERVLLSSKNIRIKYLYKKLDSKFMGLF